MDNENGRKWETPEWLEPFIPHMWTPTGKTVADVMNDPGLDPGSLVEKSIVTAEMLTLRKFHGAGWLRPPKPEPESNPADDWRGRYPVIGRGRCRGPHCDAFLVWVDTGSGRMPLNSRTGKPHWNECPDAAMFKTRVAGGTPLASQLNMFQLACPKCQTMAPNDTVKTCPDCGVKYE